MERIVNLKNDHYVIWSSVVDAPITNVKTYIEMESYIKSWPSNDFDESSKKRIFFGLLEKAKKWGVSTQLVKSDDPKDQIKELIYKNRAGEGDECLTADEIIKQYSV